jgi:transposase
VSKPQLIDDEEHERVFERVAAVDVAKASGMVCTRLPHPSRPGARRSTVWTVTATMGAVGALAAQLAGQGIEKVTLESTSDYWRIWFYVLEAAGLDVQLVTASQARQLSGRPKTDRLDAMWLARLTEKGLLRASFVPPPEIRALRDYTRARTHLTQDRTRCWQRLEKLLEDALIKVSAVASKLTTVSAQDMIKALIGGQRDPQVLAGLARGRMKAKHDALAEALTGMFDDHHGELAGLLLDQISFLDARISQLTTAITGHLATIRAAWGIDTGGATGPGAGTGPDAAVLPAAARLDEIPGISAELAASIIAETGLDMTRFPTAAHLVSWAGLCPPTRQSGPRTRQSKPARAAPTCAATSARLPSPPHAPQPSSASATAGSPAAAATPKPRSPSPAPSCSSSGTCSPTLGSATPTSAPATTKPRSTRPGKHAITSASSKPSATPLPSPRPPDRPPGTGGPQSRLRRRCRAPGRGPLFSGQWLGWPWAGPEAAQAARVMCPRALTERSRTV